MNTKGQTSSIIVVLVAFILIAIVFALANFPMLNKLLAAGSMAEVSFDLDEKGSSVYALMESKKGTTNMEMLGMLYFDDAADITFLMNGADNLFDSYVMSIKTSSGESKFGVIRGRDSPTSLEFWVPVPGARASNTKTKVVLRYD